MAQRIKAGDHVKLISGAQKGTTGKVEKVNTKTATALVEGIGTGHRHVKPSQLNPRGGKRDFHTPIDLSKLALVVDEKTSQTSRVAYSKDSDGNKVRLAKALKNKEIK